VPLDALVLVVAAAFSHSLWNLMLKHEARRAEASLGALLVGAAACSPVLLVHSPLEIPAAGWLAIAASGVLETAYVLALTTAYGAGDLSLVYPVARGSAPVFVVPLAVLLLGERLSAQGAAGVGLVVLGVFALHAGPGTFAGSRASRRALGWALVTGVCIAGYSLVNKIGVSLVPVVLYAMLVFAVDAALLLAVLRLRGARTPGPPVRWRTAVGVGVLMMATYLAVLAAMARAPVSYVVAAREVSVVVAAVLGAVALRESRPLLRVAGAAVVFAGLAVLALSR
jgi:drug/metabolite transporter (DMT)-like permease